VKEVYNVMQLDVNGQAGLVSSARAVRIIEMIRFAVFFLFIHDRDTLACPYVVYFVRMFPVLLCL
jgi:hypothetical protein